MTKQKESVPPYGYLSKTGLEEYSFTIERSDYEPNSIEFTPVNDRELSQFLDNLKYNNITSDKELAQFTDNLEFNAVDGDTTLEPDPFQTPNQSERDNQITTLLTAYVTFYQSKVRHSTICRYIILVPCILIICVFSCALLRYASQIIAIEKEIGLANVVSFITACISFISLIISLLTTITKYFFPENDEQYITKIVESIQANDLETKRERASRNNSTSQK